jgi:hypothetical protein
MRYRTEGTAENHDSRDTGAYETLEEALLGLQATMKDFTHGSIKEDCPKETFSIIHMWREKNSPICYTRIHFERIHLFLEKEKGVTSPSLPPPKKFETV